MNDIENNREDGTCYETFGQRLALIKKRITEYEKKYHREANSVHLLLASKGQSIENIKAAYEAGQRLFGENYIQEALHKINLLANLAIEWHFIGSIQTNKTRKIAEQFAWVHCVTNAKIAERLNRQRPAHLPPLNICIEVNVSHEASKSGVIMSDLNNLVDECLRLPKLKLRGFMTIPAIHHEFKAQRQEFHKLYLLWKSFCDKGISLDTLSMGMSGDFEAAIAEGATIIRLGSLLFGERKTSKN
jgi:pyridoxal phosphate enzyme (YggS family)